MLTLSQRIKFVASDLPRGWQRKLAIACGVTATSVSDWTTGKSKSIEYDHAIRAAEFLGVDAIWLRTGEGGPHAVAAVKGHPLNEDRQLYAKPPNHVSVSQAVEVIRLALIKVDALTREQAKPIFEKLFFEPEQSEHLGRRLEKTLAIDTPAMEAKRAA